jgi:cytidylate kinase
VDARVICISHATGAEGEAVGRAVAERLGFRYVDDEVIGEAAEWAELSPAFVADAERRRPLLARMLGHVAEQTSPTRLASGDATRSMPTDVIVAHAASLALAGRNVLRVLVTASPETRAGRVAAARGVDERAAARVVKDEDAARADYLKRFYGVDRELPTHFDLVVNTDVLVPGLAAELVLAAVG